MSILAHLRSKDPRAGFVTDFPELVERLVPIPFRNKRDCELSSMRARVEPALVRDALW